ncbi:MAG: hypothetical protein IJF78_16500 [Clostridia bacterium]|nr:hypothetical protein [Clostridia bacterium]
MKTFRTVMCVTFTLILTAALCAGLMLTAVTASIRLAFTPENVYRTMSEINYAGVVLPDGYGGFGTVLELFNEQLGFFGMELNENDFNELIRMLSIDDILTVFVQDFRAWLLDYGPTPALDPYEMAELALSGVDPSIVRLLGIFNDPVDTVAAFLSRVSDIADIGERLEALEPVRTILSEGTLVLECSLCLLLGLLLLLIHRMKAAPALVACSAAVSAAGASLLFAPLLLNDWKNYMLASLQMPESTFNIVYLPLIGSIRSLGSMIALIGLTVMIFTIVIWVFSSMIRREKELAAKMAEERMNHTGGYGF